MKLIQIVVFIILAFQAKCQLREVIYQNNTNELLSTIYHQDESVSWTISDGEILWQYYDKDSNLLLNENYIIVSTTKLEEQRSIYYIAKSTDNSLIKFHFWILDDSSKCVTVGYSNKYVNYFGNVSFNVIL